MTRIIALPHPDPRQPPIEVDLDDERSIAVLRDRNGVIVDVANNFDTAQSMVLEGYVAEVLRDATAYYTVERMQRALDADARAYEDCWGVPLYVPDPEVMPLPPRAGG